MIRREGDTIRLIREAVLHRHLGQPFGPRHVNQALGIDWAGTFLPKHRVGNTGGNTELFVRVNSHPALYFIRDE